MRGAADADTSEEGARTPHSSAGSMAFMGGNTAEWHKLVDGLSFADDATDANAFSGHFGLADMARAADAIDRVPAPPDPALADPIREAASAARCAKEHFSGQRLAVRQRRSTQSTSFVQPPQPLER